MTERTTLEAMISHSDNTGTDMTLKHIGVDNVRDFIAKIGFAAHANPKLDAPVPCYMFGAANCETVTWDEVVALAKLRRFPCAPAD